MDSEDESENDQSYEDESIENGASSEDDAVSDGYILKKIMQKDLTRSMLLLEST